MATNNNNNNEVLSADEILVAGDPTSCKDIFWSALTADNEELAVRAGKCINVSPVVQQSFDFDEDVAGEIIEAGEEGTLVQPIEPNSPSVVENAWNSNKLTSLVMLDFDTMCLCKKDSQAGKLDYRACAEENCDKTNHKDLADGGTGHPPIKIRLTRDELDEKGTLAIMVPSSTTNQKTHTLFSRPVFHLINLPAATLSLDRHLMLLRMEFMPRVWKFLFEQYPGKDRLMEGRWRDRGSIASSPPSSYRTPQGSIPQGMEEVTQTPDIRALVFENQELRVRTSVKTVNEDGDSIASEGRKGGTTVEFKSPSYSQPQVDRTSMYGWNKPLPDNTMSAPDEGSVHSRMSRLSALGTDPDFASLGNKVDLISRTMNKFKAETAAKDEDLGKIIYSLRVKLDTQERLLEDLRHSNQELEGMVHNPPSTYSHQGPSSGHLSSSDRESIANEVIALLDMSSYARKSDIESLATKTELGSYLKNGDMAEFAKVSLLSDYVSSTHLNNMNFVDKAELELAMTNLGIPERLLDRVVQLEREVNDPDGCIHRMEDTIKELLSTKRGGAGVSIGGISFKDEYAAEAWTQLLEGDDIYRYGYDMKLQILGLSSSAHSTSEVIKDMADANRAGFSSTAAALVKASFVVTLPESVFKESNQDADASKGGVKFTPSFSSPTTFEGDAEYSAKGNMLSSLSNNRNRHQAALDLRFPSDQPKHAKAHAVFSAILRLGYFQAVGFLESLLPFNKMMEQSGMSPGESWKKCLTYARAVFTRIHEVRTVSTEHTAGSMLYGMMRVTRMLESYGELGWIRHPDVSSALVVAALQKDGKGLSETVAAQVRKVKDPQVASNKNNIADLKAQLKKINDKLNDK